MHLHLQTQARVWCGGEVGPGHVLLCPGRGQQQPHVRAPRPTQPEHARVPGEPGAAGGGRGGGGGGDEGRLLLVAVDGLYDGDLAGGQRVVLPAQRHARAQRREAL